MLATVRCLSAHGYEVTAIGTSPAAPGLWSRAVSARRLAPDARRDVDGFLRKLVTIARGSDHDVLLPGTDAALLVVSHYRELVEPYVRLGLPPHETVERALDKERLGAEAAIVGLPAPESRLCESVEAALDAARSFGFPVIVKPIHTAVEEAGATSRRASQPAADGEAVRSAWRAFGRCIVQRWDRGSVISFGGVATNQGLLGFAVSRYARLWPPQAGNVSFSETIDPPGVLVERVEALIAALGWEGVFELELIDHPGGGFSAIDFNPRPYGSLGLAAAAGVPLPALWCEWLLGGTPRPRRAAIGVRYRWEDADLRHAAWQLSHGAPALTLKVLRPQRNVTHAYLRARDPAPAVARALQLARQLPRLSTQRRAG